MELHLISIISFLLLVVAARSASIPSEAYWNAVLPNTPMPKAVRELLHPDGAQSEIWIVQADDTVRPADPFHYASGVTKDDTVRPADPFHYKSSYPSTATKDDTVRPADPFHYMSGVAKDDAVRPADPFHYMSGVAKDDTVRPADPFHYMLGVAKEDTVRPADPFHYTSGVAKDNAEKPADPFHYTSSATKDDTVRPADPFHYMSGVAKDDNVRPADPFHYTSGAAKDDTVRLADPFHYTTGVTKDDTVRPADPFHYTSGVTKDDTVRPAEPYNYASEATKAQLESDPNARLFFHEKDLHLGKTMNLQFFRSTRRTTFLPHHVVSAIPFSSDKLHEIMDHFAVDPKSSKAKAMKRTIETCEEPAQEREEKACATSLENMVDFSVSKLGKHVHPLSTEVDKEYTPQQQYTIAAEVEKVGENSVVCHTQAYAYAVFYCHTTRFTKTYKVPMIGGDGTRVMAVAVCHTDTAKWNPMHMGFQVLKVKPGTVPVCHFLPEDHIVWASK